MPPPAAATALSFSQIKMKSFGLMAAALVKVMTSWLAPLSSFICQRRVDLGERRARSVAGGLSMSPAAAPLPAKSLTVSRFVWRRRSERSRQFHPRRAVTEVTGRSRKLVGRGVDVVQSPRLRLGAAPTVPPPEQRGDVDVPERAALSAAPADPDRRFRAAAPANLNAKPILVVTGLAMEARIAAGPGVEVVCSGCDPARLQLLLDAVTPSRYRGVISFGVSGALDPALAPGDIVVASEIKSDAGDWPLESPLSRALAEHLGRSGQVARRAGLAGVDAPVMQAIDKAALRQKTGAAAVDMESHVAASFGAAAGLPVCALRVISDPAHRCLPPLAARALKANGRVDLAAVCSGLAGNPRQIPLLIQAGRDARTAFAALRRVRRLFELGLGLGGADLG